MITIKNRRYLGNKTKLLDFIKETIASECGEFNSIFDVFAGTGAVASAFLDKTVITNDILYSNYISHIAWFKKESFNKNKIKNILNLYNSLPDDLEDNYMSLNFADTYFSKNTCKKIGYIREDIEKRYKEKKLNEKEYAILITSLLYAMDRIANTCGHYDAWRKNVTYDDNLNLQMLDIPQNTKKSNKFYNTDSNKIAKTIKCDIAYLDPPYNSRQYCDAYHLLENVAKWNKPEVFGVAKKMNRDSLKSDYCKNSAAEAFEKLIQDLNCKYIVLSYNNTGDTADGRSNAKISDRDIFSILKKKGTVKVFTQKYKAYSAGKSENDNNEERLFVCKVYSKDSFIESPLNYTGGKTKLLPQILPYFPKQISQFVDLFCGGCNVGINITAEQYFYNDINSELIGLFKIFKNNNLDKIKKDVEKIISDYNLSNSSENGYEFYSCESSSGLKSYNNEHYLRLRNDFNILQEKNYDYYIKLYVLIVFAFNNQIRFNSNGDFNLPCGKRDFNNSLQNKLNNFTTRIHAQNTVFSSIDFKEFDISGLDENSFVYIDPPYLASTASYNENGGWTEIKEQELLEFLDKLTANNIKFALSNVLKNNNNENKILADWLNKNKDKYYTHHLNYNYSNSNYQRKGKDDTDEVLILNYNWKDVC